MDATLEWSANTEPDLAGYRVFYRAEGQYYDYTNPSWEGAHTICTIYGLDETKSYYFVARAFDTEGLESGNSNEVYLEAGITPYNKIPIADADPDLTSGIVPLTVTFDGSGSYDPDGEVVSYDWDFGDGTIDSGETVSHTFTDTGVYTVTLTVADNQGVTDSDTIQISASSESGLDIEAEDMPIKTTGGPTSEGWNIWSNGYIAETVDFSMAGTYTFEVMAKGSYAGEDWPIMEVRIDQNEVGTVRVDASSWAVYTIQAYVSSGTHEVAIAFTNDYYSPPEDRNLYVDKTTITDAGSNPSPNAPPEASIFSDSIGGIAPLSVNLDGSGSYDEDGEIVSYYWDFGDGTTDSGETVSHIFRDPGEYTVTLTVTDNQGSTDSDTIEIIANSGSGLVIEAEDMPIKTSGRPVSDGWNLWSDGYIADNVDFPTRGIYTFEVSASGIYDKGAWPIMEVRIDQTPVGTVEVDDSSWAIYTIETEVVSGMHEVAIGFANDYKPPKEKNLYVDNVSIFP